MSWIESHQSLSRHKKTLRASSLLKVDRHKLIGHLHELWWWALDNADTDGALDLITAGEIAGAAGWPEKKADEFVQALVLAGFIEDENGQPMRLHNWYEYAGKLNDRRTAERERSKNRRSTGGQPADVGQTTAGTVPTVPTVPDQPNPPSEAVASPKPRRQAERRRLLDDESVAELQAEPENAYCDVAAVARDYLNWVGSDGHKDQVQGLRNQLEIPGKRARFPRKSNGAQNEYAADQASITGRYNLALAAMVTAGKCESTFAAKELLPFDEWRQAEFGEATG